MCFVEEKKEKKKGFSRKFSPSPPTTSYRDAGMPD
jgi:hypothetical protein